MFRSATDARGSRITSEDTIGSMLDVDFGDLLDYVGNDPHVQSVLLYIESLTNFRKFMSAARAVSRMKPVIILKSDISHKSEVDGVKLDLRTDSELRRAFEGIMGSARRHKPEADIHGVTLQPMRLRPDAELLIGAKQDPDFGPVILFGMGGIYAEIIRDRNIGLVPLNRLLARRLMEGTKTYTLLKGYRNRSPADLKRLEAILVCLSQLVTDFPEITELDMNPLVVESGQPLAMDARVQVKTASVATPHHLVISPYPQQYEKKHIITDGLSLTIRPIKPEDAPLLEDLFDNLSLTTI
ncbi:MAG: acetate--CoA ligase family protein [Desulfobacterales bacterium]